MAAVSGKSGVLSVSVTAGGAGTYSTVLGVMSVSAELDGEILDVTELPATSRARIQGLQDAKLSATLTYQPADTNGQAAIRSALVNNTVLYYKYLPDGTSGWKQQCIVTKFAIGNAVSGVVDLAIDLSGTGIVTLI